MIWFIRKPYLLKLIPSDRHQNLIERRSIRLAVAAIDVSDPAITFDHQRCRVRDVECVHAIR